MTRVPTIEDIAKEAGVSKSTVSRVINHSKRISKETKEKVLTIANRIGYEPNKIARSLIKNKTYTIGVILEDIINPFFAEVAKGIENILKQHSYTMLLASTDYEKKTEYKLTQLFMQYKVDGILITPFGPNSGAVKLLEQRQIPFFMINCKSESRNVSWIDSDNFEGGYLATSYLLNLGHTGFMCITNRNISGAFDRYRGFKKALEEKGIIPDEKLVFDGARSGVDGYNTIMQFLSSHKKEELPQAIIAVNDAVAIGVMKALIENGLRIPDDISIIGYDDINIANLIRVPLTTIHQSKFKMGEIAAKRLIEKIEGGNKKTAQHIIVEPKLIIRHSCKGLNK